MKIQDPAYLFRQQDGVRLSPVWKRRDDKYLVAVCIIYTRRVALDGPVEERADAFVYHSIPSSLSRRVRIHLGWFVAHPLPHPL